MISLAPKVLIKKTAGIWPAMRIRATTSWASTAVVAKGKTCGPCRRSSALAVLEFVPKRPKRIMCHTRKINNAWSPLRKDLTLP